MPRIDGKELLILKGAGGELFARFVDRLIRAEASAGGLAQSEIDTQVRVNIGDGGVDTRVRSSIPEDRSGYLSDPTCWQYKAETYNELMAKGTVAEPLRFLIREVNKPEVRRLVEQGCAFRFCMIGDLTPENVQKWEALLLIECQKMNAMAAGPRVVAADKLAAWAERFPATASLIRPLGSDESAQLFNFPMWRSNVRAVTREYVAVGAWAIVSSSIITHVTTRRALDACLSIQGEAGVGKTRLVFETLSGLSESESLVLYTRDEQVALTLSRQLAIDPTQPSAVVVADECLLQTRMMIEQNLVGCRDRVRFICISNTGERGATGAPELWLEEMPRNVVEEILNRNFPLVPRERRNAYAELAGGFIRFAAALCEDDDRLASGNLSSALGRVADYIRFRLRGDEEKNVLYSLALFTTIGAKANAAPQLASLCNITGMSPRRVVEIAERLRDSPGFVSVAGRFLYVTPAIVAHTAFAHGWERWVKHDPKAFIDKLHPNLVGAYLDRVRTGASEEVKAAVAATFQQWVASRRAEDLKDRRQVERLATLVEPNADSYLPLLRRLVETASGDTLRFVDGYGRSSRRELVWLCERLAAFSNYYEDCESILFRLATEESEPHIGNNATGIWCQLQRIFLSGSSAPFAQRFAILGRRVKESRDRGIELCMKGVKAIFATNIFRMGSPATVGGRLRPPDWQPQAQQEHRACWASTLALLYELAVGDNDVKAVEAVDLTIGSLFHILNNEFLIEARSILNDQTPARDRMPQIIEAIEGFLEWPMNEDLDAPAAVNDGQRARYMESVRSWLTEITPTHFGGRLRTLLSRNQWDDSVADAKGHPTPGLTELASEALRNPLLLEAEVPYLTSGAAPSAVLLGDALGQLDVQQRSLDTIFHAIRPGADISLARGYLFGLLRTGGSLSPELEQWLAKVEAIDTRIAFELRLTGGDKLRAYEFAVRAVDEGRLPVGVLTQFAFGERPTLDRIRGALRRLVAAMAAGADETRALLTLMYRHNHNVRSTLRSLQG
jgi:hypothetical protein